MELKTITCEYMIVILLGKWDVKSHYSYLWSTTSSSEKESFTFEKKHLKSAKDKVYYYLPIF